ncbi:hypothetical protein BJ878DRAFT_327317 [Calycina marina]|uniref:Uncharacterized protein n=1 Tax=Calycina marina TaxID=1763456 RepID=A0A9P7ZB25_9HELO|nr:hypothetical protein BJ878DRAFT_327317 [Calycina marina]
MSQYYHYNSHAHSSGGTTTPTASHHTGRGRRAPRLSQNSHAKQQMRTAKKEEEAQALANFRQRFELGRSFDMDDDLEFCPNLIDDADRDMYSITSSGSDRSSLSSGSPEHSPQAHQVIPETFSLNTNTTPYVPPYNNHTASLKMHQPAATRTRSAIPIVNPATGRMSSPPHTLSPARMNHQSPLGRRW